MFIKKSNYQELLKKIQSLEKELTEAKDLQNILMVLAEKTGISVPKVNGYLSFRDGSIGWEDNFHLPDNVLVQVDDILGGKVTKQEGIKCIIIEKDGSVKTGLTKQNSDDGYDYKLVRNK